MCRPPTSEPEGIDAMISTSATVRVLEDDWSELGEMSVDRTP